MSDSIVFLLFIQVVLIALNAIFASAEIAVLSINETKLERMAEEGNKKAKRLFRLTQEPAKFLATIQVAITLSGFLGSAFAADNFSDPLVDWVMSLGVPIPHSTMDTVAVVLITIILSYFTLIFGELVPKRIAMKKSEQLAMGISGLVSGISVLFKPIVWFLSMSTNLVLRIFGIDPNEVEDQVSEEEIRMLIDAGSEKGAIEYTEKEFIDNVFEFNDIDAGDIATHRTDVTILWLEDDAHAWKETIHKSRHTQYPVCDGSPDDVIGILNAKDYFRLEDKKTKENIMKYAVRPAYFVPETIKADVLFRNMNQTGNTIAVVMDEHGGMVGIITLYDLIEELVGELNDGSEDAENRDPYLEKIDDKTWKVVGNIDLSDIEDELGIEIETDDIDTFTGLVFDVFGVIPDDGPQNIDLEIQNMIIHVSYIDDHQIQEATIQLKPEEEAAEEKEK
ncbi:MAG TPA: HlyC/CorC family transporter [Candidatus Fimousia stercorigallinarum]|nr:HlyC/CorC family transporter [Candidatus Fimousia stercorigallinarum]